MDEVSSLRGIFSGAFIATARPGPIPGDLRIAWGLSLLLLVLASSRGLRCSLQKAHFLAHLSRTEKTRNQTRLVLARKKSSAELTIRIEPWVNRAAAYAKAVGLVEAKDGKALVLTDAGRTVVAEIRSAKILLEEVAFLDEIGKFATEKLVETIIKMEAF